jgi:hypothetical protein
MDVSAWMREQEIRRDIDGFGRGAARARRQKIHEANSARQRHRQIISGLRWFAQFSFAEASRFLRNGLVRGFQFCHKFRTALLSYLIARYRLPWRIIFVLAVCREQSAATDLSLAKAWPAGCSVGFA